MGFFGESSIPRPEKDARTFALIRPSHRCLHGAALPRLPCRTSATSVRPPLRNLPMPFSTWLGSRRVHGALVLNRCVRMDSSPSSHTSSTYRIPLAKEPRATSSLSVEVFPSLQQVHSNHECCFSSSGSNASMKVYVIFPARGDSLPLPVFQ